MADIFPTGYFAAARFLKNLSPRDKKEFTAVVVGCGPVGVCAITAALRFVDTVYAIDSIPDRLEIAANLGAKPIALDDDPVGKIKAATEGRGADVVMEVVGHADAFQLCFDMTRPWGSISSIGVHTEQLPLNGLLAYGKNITMAFGRCPVRSIFEEALAMLVEEQKKVAFLCGKTMSLEDAPQAYRDFEARKVGLALFIIFPHPFRWLSAFGVGRRRLRVVWELGKGVCANLYVCASLGPQSRLQDGCQGRWQGRPGCGLSGAAERACGPAMSATCLCSAFGPLSANTVTVQSCIYFGVSFLCASSSCVCLVYVVRLLLTSLQALSLSHVPRESGAL